MFLLAFGILLVVLGLIWAFLVRNEKYSGVQTTALPIPKHIWSYWHSAELPKSVQLCKESWQLSMPDYVVHLVNNDNLAEYLDQEDLQLLEHPSFNDSHARFADMLRLCLLKKHGGLWLDATVFLGKPLVLPNCDLFGYYLEGFTKHTPVLESWCFAAPRNSQFVSDWKREFAKLAKFDSAKAYADAKIKMIDVQQIDVPDYLAIHIAAQCLLQRGFPREHLVLNKAEDGPYLALSESGWDSEKAVQLFFDDPEKYGAIMKFRGHEREKLEKRLNHLAALVCPLEIADQS
jgi:hypothetical protein